MICGEAPVPWALRPESLRVPEKLAPGQLVQRVPGGQLPGGRHAVGGTSQTCSVFASKGEKDPQLPASLAKLFVVEYALTFARDPDTLVTVSPQSLALVKEGSSMAWIQAREYPLRDLFAAMLVPSGNDARLRGGGLLRGTGFPGERPRAGAGKSPP